MRLACGEGNPREGVAALALAFSPDGTTIATIHTDGRVAPRDPSKGRGLRFLGDRGYACALAFSPDGRHLALGDTDQTSPCATSRPREPKIP